MNRVKKYMGIVVAALLLLNPIIASASSMTWYQRIIAGMGQKEADKVIQVNSSIDITKKDPTGKPLVGIQFKVDGEDTYTTNSEGKVKIPMYKYSPGKHTLTEEAQTINNIKYTPKTIQVAKNELCYDGACFQGEVKGSDLVPYQTLVDKYNQATGQNKSIIPNISESLSKEIHDQYNSELSNGGMWLKFQDNKYKDSDGRPRIFYIAKKPLLKGISWDDLFKAGVVYGMDVVNKDGTLKVLENGMTIGNTVETTSYGEGGKYGVQNSTNPKDDKYKPLIIEAEDGKRYIVRLVYGKTNFGNTQKIYTATSGDQVIGSEWNRAMIAITKQYRGETDYMEDALVEGNQDTKYVDDNYKNQLAEYNWFGDLTLGSVNFFKYENKDIPSSNLSKGQSNWTQEKGIYLGDRIVRGHNILDDGVATWFIGLGAGSSDGNLGWRPVLEQINEDYDGVYFDGEVRGRDLITYDQLLSTTGIDKIGKPLEKLTDNSEGTKLINERYDAELASGGHWLKFTDTKYQSNGKPRTFYVAKKPLRRSISWQNLFDKGVIYGWDSIDSNGSIKSDITGIPTNYKPKIIEINGQKYIVRLLQGRTNFGTEKDKAKTSSWRTSQKSEWNRTMVAATKQYRGESTSMESLLQEGNGTFEYVINDYKHQLAKYNWSGDLTLNSTNAFMYDGKDILQSNLYNGQISWTQEFGDDVSVRSIRGYYSTFSGAAGSNNYSFSGAGDNCGWRPVLEPLNE